jgi:hypothetical protein
LSIATNDGAILLEAGPETVDTLRRVSAEFTRLEAEPGFAFEYAAQVVEPSHPSSDSVLGLWLYNPVGTAWALRVSVKTTAGVREWRDAAAASS